MRKQIGWYDPKCKFTCRMETKARNPDAYATWKIPAFIDDESKNNEQELRDKIQLQILENQYLLLKYGECILNEQQGSVPMHVESSSFTTARQNTLVLLKKEKESL